MKLNKTQRDYAVSRLADKIAQKRNDETPAFVSSKKSDMKEIYKLLTNAGVQLVPETEFVNSWGVRSIGDVIIFPVNFDKEYEENTRIRDEIRVKYETIQQEFMDKLYLCDEAQEALDLINSI
jgi:Icc-related predicted phosphoesterase